MARHERRGQHGRAVQQSAGQKEKAAAPQLTDEQRALVSHLRASTSTLAASLREAASRDRESLLAILAPVERAPEPIAVAYAAGLGYARGAEAQDAADVAEALGELSQRHSVGREARRARLRLRSAGISPTLVVPALERSSAPVAAVPLREPPAAEHNAEHAHVTHTHTEPRLVEAYASRTRETGDMSLLLGWQESSAADRLRTYVFSLSFWNEGVKHFAVLDALTRHEFQRQVLQPARDEMEMVPVSLAQARHLVLEALEANAYHESEPAAEFALYRDEINARLLREPESPEAEAIHGDREFIARDQEPDEVIANWIGAWSFGDYGLAYDLLADDHPLRRAQTRTEYIALRRQWAKEADPGSLRLTVVREQAQRASALWVPGSAGTISGGDRKDFEAFWSLILHDAAMGGQMEELPMATLISAETGRHWYWTGYTLARDRGTGLWLISRSRDEGATSQALKIDELQQRIREARETVEQITQQTPPDPRSPEAAEALRTITGALTAALHYSDALIVRLPLDESIYREAINDARSLGNHERAAALIEKLASRSGAGQRMRFELGVEQYLASEQYSQQGDATASAAWLERAVATMSGVVEAEPTAEHLQGLGELLARQGHYNQAETRLREAIQLDPERAMVYSDLADALMGRIAGENLDDPISLSTEEQQTIARDALSMLREAVRLDSSLPGVFTRMGAIYDVLHQQDDALIAFEEAIRHDPGDAEAHYTLGSLFMTRKQPAQALPHFETAVQLAPLTLPFRLGLAAAYVSLNHRQEALRELDLLDRLAPGLPQVTELRAALARQHGKR